MLVSKPALVSSDHKIRVPKPLAKYLGDGCKELMEDMYELHVSMPIVNQANFMLP